MCRFKGKTKVGFYFPFPKGPCFKWGGEEGELRFFVFSHFKKRLFLGLGWVGWGEGGVVWLFLKREVAK